MNPVVDNRWNKILLIDDEPGIRRMMSLDLTADGYQVLTAASGVEGLDIFAAEHPPIVLTDIKMPGMDGIQVLARIKAADPDTEVIVITGHGDLDLAIKSLQLEAGDFVTKPISSDALAVALKRAKDRLDMKARLRSYTEELERRVAEATAQALAAQRLATVGETVSALVHSIKNMLAGLKGGTYLIKEGLNSGTERIVEHGMEMLERNVRRVGALVYDLLTISKPREPEVRPADPVAVAVEAVDFMWPEAENKDVDLRLTERGLGLTVPMDKKAILDSVINLLSNAIDAAATVTRGRVWLSVNEGSEEVWFEVCDNGPGLDEEALEHVFEGFYSSKGASGTGLGLMVVKKTALEHGGRVEFDNRPGKGAIFRLVLPKRAHRRLNKIGHELG